MTALAMRQVGLKPAAKVVLYWLADHHNERTGACFPSIGRLAELCEMSRRAVEGHLADLEAAGLIERRPRHRETGGKTSNEYILLIAKSDAQNLRMPPAKSAHTPCAKSAHVITLEDTNLGSEPSFALSARQEPPDRFAEFWVQYPHRNGAKKGKAAAQKAWAKSLRNGATPDQIIGGAMRYASDRQVIDGYAKDPATWLNQKGWEDDIEQPGGISRHGSRPSGRGNAMVDAFASVAAARLARDRGGSGNGGGFV